jgi:3-methyladenine DNA glycosylase AlkD
VRWCLEQLATHNTEHWTRIIAAFHQALALQAHDVIKAFQLKPHP